MEDKRFSLTRVRLTNYKSIASADVSLGDLLFLVGPNGSGKSNFLDALRLTSESLQTSLQQAIRIRGGIKEVTRKLADSSSGSFAIDLEFRGSDFKGAYGFEVGSTEARGPYIANEYCDVLFDPLASGSKHGADARFIVVDGRVEFGTEPVMPPSSLQRLYLVTAAGLDVFRPVFDGLAGIGIFNPSPEAMRRPQEPDTGEFLHKDGSNVASVMRGIPSSEYKRVEEYLSQIVPGMHSVRIVDVGRWETLRFTQDVAGSRTGLHPQSVSDGTLRALGVLVALFAGTGGTYSPIGIEEPESALHPAATGVLLDALRDASERRQVMVTSHSPDLMDRHDFDLSQLRAVRSIDGETVIGELDPAGAMALREDLYTPGELLRTDQLLPAKPENTEAQ